MAQSSMTSHIENGRTLVLERVFAAPADRTFRMFAVPELLARWWGPRGFELTHNDLDFTPGGTWHYCMTGVADSPGEYKGVESWGKAVFTAIDAPRSFAYTDWFSDAAGNSNEEMPVTQVHMEFIDLGSKTRLVSRSEYADAAALEQVLQMGMLQGITETWDRLEEELAATYY